MHRGRHIRPDGRSAHAESTLCGELTGISVKSPGDTSGPPMFTPHTGGAHPAVRPPSPTRRRRKSFSTREPGIARETPPPGKAAVLSFLRGAELKLS